MNYYEYINSHAWDKKKKEFRKSHMFTDMCFVCGSKESLEIHHKTYIRLGNERLSDLVAICRKCHQITHLYTIKNGTKKRSLWRCANTLRKIRKDMGLQIGQMFRGSYRPKGKTNKNLEEDYIQLVCGNNRPCAANKVHGGGTRGRKITRWIDESVITHEGEICQTN